MCCILRRETSVPILMLTARASDFTTYFNMAEDRAGYQVEHGPTNPIPNT